MAGKYPPPQYDEYVEGTVLGNGQMADKLWRLRRQAKELKESNEHLRSWCDTLLEANENLRREHAKLIRKLRNEDRSERQRQYRLAHQPVPIRRKRAIG